MNSEGTFRLAFWVLLGLMILMRIWFAIRVSRAGERLMPDQAAIRREGWKIYAIRLVCFPVAHCLDCAACPQSLLEAEAGFPLAILAALGWLCFGTGQLWASGLGRMWRWGRSGQPSCNFVRTTGWSLPAPTRESGIPCTRPSWHGRRVSVSWLPTGFPSSSRPGRLVILVARVPREEQMMLDQFGDEYREYMKRTGRFLPKW